jgi:hypothetical protein
VPRGAAQAVDREVRVLRIVTPAQAAVRAERGRAHRGHRVRTGLRLPRGRRG